MPAGCGGCCPEVFCHDAYGDTLPVSISGITTCSGCYNDGLNDYNWSITGINGSFNMAWVVSDWQATNGSITVNKYDSNDGTCTGLNDFQIVDIAWFVSCTGENMFTASGGLASALTFGFTLAIYASTGAVGPGDPQPSSLVAGDCGLNQAGAYDGVFTVDV